MTGFENFLYPSCSSLTPMSAPVSADWWKSTQVRPTDSSVKVAVTTSDRQFVEPALRAARVRTVLTHQVEGVVKLRFAPQIVIMDAAGSTSR